MDDGVVEDAVTVHVEVAALVNAGDRLTIHRLPDGSVIVTVTAIDDISAAPTLESEARPLVPLPEGSRDDRVRDREQERADYHDGHDAPADNCPRCGTAFNLAPLPESVPLNQINYSRSGGPGGTT